MARDGRTVTAEREHLAFRKTEKKNLKSMCRMAHNWKVMPFGNRLSIFIDSFAQFGPGCPRRGDDNDAALNEYSHFVGTAHF
jgi:hypothetical protein